MGGETYYEIGTPFRIFSELSPAGRPGPVSASLGEIMIDLRSKVFDRLVREPEFLGIIFHVRNSPVYTRDLVYKDFKKRLLKDRLKPIVILLNELYPNYAGEQISDDVAQALERLCKQNGYGSSSIAMGRTDGKIKRFFVWCP